MSALMNKVWDLFGMDSAEPEEYEDEDVYDYGEDEEEVEDKKIFGRKNNNKVVNMPQQQSQAIKMVISQPTTFEQSDEICSFLKEKKSVIVNLEYVNKDVARRIVDFISGGVYALDGYIQKVSNSIFLVAPSNYEITNEMATKQMMNGYNVEEVDDFLDELTEDYTKNYKEVNELREKVEELNNSLVQYKAIESTLQDTLVMAQTTAEEVKNVAKQKADQIVEEAKATAQKQVDDLNNEIVAKQKEVDDIKKQFDIYKAKMESLLISQLELLKDVNKETNAN